MAVQPARPANDDLADQLAQLEEQSERGREAGSLDAMLVGLKAELDTVVAELRQPSPPDAYEQETACHRAIQTVQSLGDPQNAADRTVPSTGDTHQHSATEVTPLATLGVYELLAKLGEGGMGAVYKARHAKLDKIVAVKVLPRARLKDLQAVNRFEREMRAVGKLEHLNIVRAMDAGELEGTHFLVMEYVPGIDLSQLVKRHGPLPIADACELVRQAAVGLEEAHDNGMVHRDIKPSNLMLCAAGKKKPPVVKILDLGLALLSEAYAPDAQGLTTTGQAMGTLDYMAPEQGGDSHEVDIRADIYSLGATLYKLLTGEAIYHGEKYQTPVQKMMALATHPAPSIQSRRARIPDGLAAIMQRMLAKNPRDRFATPQEVAAALAPFCAGADLQQLLTGGVQASPKEEAQSATIPSHSAPELDTGVSAPAKVQISPRPAKQPLSDGRKTPPWLPTAIGGGLFGAAGLLALASIVFYVPTPTGTLRVEINDPSIQVLVTGTNIVLKKGDKEETTLTPGEHTLTVKRGDFEFTTNKFELKKDGETTVKVEILPGELRVVTAEGTPLGGRKLAGPTGDSDRRAAQWVIKRGGKAEVTVEGIQLSIEGDIASLPASPFKLSGVTIGFMMPATPADLLQQLQGVTGLSRLDALGVQFSDADLESWTSQPNLANEISSLRLRGDQISATGLAHLKRFHQLKTLELRVPQINRDGLKNLAQITTLEHLDLYAPVTDAGLGELAGLKLKSIGIFDAKVTDAGLAHLRAMPLQSVGLACPITDSSLSQLKGFSELRSLRIEKTQVTDAGLATVAELPTVVQLSLTGPFSNPGMAHLKRMKGLVYLAIFDARLTDDAMVDLAELKELQGLTLQRASITDASLEHFKRLTNLTHLDVLGAKVTSEGANKLHAALPGCGIVTDYGTLAPSPLNPNRLVAQWVLRHNGAVQLLVNGQAVDIAGAWPTKNVGGDPQGESSKLPAEPFKILRISFWEQHPVSEDDLIENVGRLDSLGEMHLYGGCPLTDAGLQRLESLPAVEKHLRGLTLNGTRLTGKGLESLQRLPQLNWLSVQSDKFSGADLAHLRKLPLQYLSLTSWSIEDGDLEQLREMPLGSLALSTTKITDNGMATIGSMNNLVSLTISQQPITDAGIQKLIGMKKLGILNLADTEITDAGLDTVASLEHLFYLVLSNTHITDAGLAKLEKAKGLQSLSLPTTITEAGATRLAAKLPQCLISWKGGSIQPRQMVAAADREKPFVLVRDGKVVGEFKTFVGVREELAAGDEIVVHGNEPIELPLIELTDMGLSIKAGPGYRPRFRPSASVPANGITPWISVAKFPVRLEGCDFISDVLNLPILSAGGDCDISACRIVKSDAHNDFILQLNGKRARIADSLILGGFSHQSIMLGPKLALEFENNIYWNRSYIFFSPLEPGGQNIKLTNNTLFGGGHLLGVHGKPGQPLSVELTGNIIGASINPGWLIAFGEWSAANLKEFLHWRGQNNLLINDGPSAFITLDDPKGRITKLEDWQKFWGDTDQGMREVKARPFQFDVGWAGKTDAQRLDQIRKAIEAARPSLLKDAGPAWDQIGPGAGYINALAAAGKPVPNDKLRPEALEGGPVVLVRNGKAIAGYRDVSTAADVAADGDVIELRTDKELPIVSRFGAKPKALTLRAGPGYRPVMNNLGLETGDVWGIEGIHFKGVINPHNGYVTGGHVPRLANCSFAAVPEVNSQLVACLTGNGKAKEIEIVNCLLPTEIWLSNLSPSARVVARNSIFGMIVSYLDNCEGDQALALDRCVFWQPAQQHWPLASNLTKSSLAVKAHGCWFETGKVWGNIPTGRIKWEGDNNVYRLGTETWCWLPAREGDIGTTRLEKWQKDWSSDAHSVALDPLHFDPAQWKLLEGAPGRGAGPVGKDLGADVSKVVPPVPSVRD